MEIKTFLVGGSKKFQDRFLQKINARLKGDLILNLVSRMEWDNWGDNKRKIHGNPDLTLVMKSNISHSLRDWAKSQSNEQGILFCECSHKVAIAELDLRHVFGLEVSSEYAQDEEDLELSEEWEKVSSTPLIWEGESNPYTDLPWVSTGKQTMIRQWVKANKGRYELTSKNGLKEYNKLLDFLKNREEGTLAGEGVTAWASAWAVNANPEDFKGLANMDYALGLMFGRSLNTIDPEVTNKILDRFKSPAPTVSPTPTHIEPPEEIPTSTLPTSTLPDHYALIGGVVFSPTNETSIFIEEVSLTKEIELVGNVTLEVGHMTADSLFNVYVKGTK